MDGSMVQCIRKRPEGLGPPSLPEKLKSTNGGQGTWMEDPEAVAQLRNNVLTAGTITVSLSCDR